MSYHTALVDYTNKLNSAIESMDVEKIVSICQQAVALIKQHEPMTLADKDVVTEFTKSHAVAETLLKEVRERLLLEAGRSKNARKGIQKYKGVSSNV